MKYLHSGYILFCERAEHDDNGMLNVYGLFDVFELKELPAKMNCAWVIGFGTPYERRQYKGILLVEDPKGQKVLEIEFAANDPHDNGQSLSTLLGKMLRIDVLHRDGERPYTIPPDNPFIGRPDARPEIWAYGFRNPWRYSFDSVTGLLYAADVGQYDREEIDVVKKGANYGWRVMEGTICTPAVSKTCERRGFEMPIYDYPTSPHRVVIGGFVYRGSALKGLCGAYVYGDYGDGGIFALRYDGKQVVSHTVLLETDRKISSFGQDRDGELYVVDHDGEVLKLVPATP